MLFSEGSEDRLYLNDIVYKFETSCSGTSIAIGKVELEADPEFSKTDLSTPVVNWYEGGTKKKEKLECAMDKSKVFVFNREVYIGCTVIIRDLDQAGYVASTKHGVLGLIEKTLKDGTKRRFVLPRIPLERLKNEIPVKQGDYILHKEWIGQVTSLTVKTLWTLDNSNGKEFATITHPFEVLRMLGLKLNDQVEKIPEVMFKFEHACHSGMWSVFGSSKYKTKPATLKEITPLEIHAKWFEPVKNPGASQDPPSEIIKSEEFESIQLFHVCNNDWNYFGNDKSFKMTWTLDDEEKVLPFEQWQARMLLTSTGLSFGEEPVVKRQKAESDFEVGKEVTVTPIGMQTSVSVFFTNGPSVIKHVMDTNDIPEMGLSVYPRTNFVNFRKGLKNMDMVKDRLEYASKYGFVMDPHEIDGMVQVKWIYDLAGQSSREETQMVSKYDLEPHMSQEELNPKKQRKIAFTRDGKWGTLKGVSYPSCKAVIRPAGTFSDEEYWPHEVSFFNRTIVYDRNSKKWNIGAFSPKKSNEKAWLEDFFKVTPKSVIIAPSCSHGQSGAEQTWSTRMTNEEDAFAHHSFKKDMNPTEMLDPEMLSFLDLEIRNLQLDLKNFLELERFASRPDLLTVYIAAPTNCVFEGVLFIVDISFPKGTKPSDVNMSVEIGFRPIDDYVPDWPTTKLDSFGQTRINIQPYLRNGKSPLYQLISSINGIILSMDPFHHKPSGLFPDENPIDWQYSILTVMEYSIATLYKPPTMMTTLIGSHYFNQLINIWSGFAPFIARYQFDDDFGSVKTGSQDLFGCFGEPSAAFKESLARRFQLLLDLLVGSDKHKIFLEIDAESEKIILKKMMIDGNA